MCDVRGLRGVRDPRICFLLPECHMKLVNVAGNKLCLLSTSCGGACAFVWRGVCLRVEGEAVAEASNAARAARAIATRARPWAP